MVIRRKIMFRKSVFIVLFACLSATISSADFTPSANYPWDNQLAWNTDNTDANWYNPANWTDVTCPPDGPGLNNEVAMMPMIPGPHITGDANAAMLMFNGWDPTSYGPKDGIVTIEATAGLCNFGATIQLNSCTDYDSYLGTPDLVSRAILNVYGGTVITPTHTNNWTNLSGLHIGGGYSNYSNAYGLLNMYGGEVNVPRIEIHFGGVNLYGGTLKCNGEPNFSINQYRPNFINMNGGTLKLAGDWVTNLPTLIASRHIVCLRPGDYGLGVPTYPVVEDGISWTVLTSDGNMVIPWGPIPENNATNVHYKNGDINSITLKWNQSDEPNDVNYDVYFGATLRSHQCRNKGNDGDIQKHEI